MHDPLVHIHKSVLMQRLLDAACRGYHWHTHGSVSVDKAARLSAKFAQLYRIDRNANQRAYAQRQGKANARLFMFATETNSHLDWWLLCTDGDGAVHELERLQNAYDKRHRVRIGNDYELLRRTRKRGQGGGTVWSWRMTHVCLEHWRVRVINACRRRESLEVSRVLASLYRVPGFSGTREQVGKLVNLARTEWRRHHGDLEGLMLPPRLAYVERLPDTSVPLSELIKR
ncbi:hypothetical protein [Thioalkalivibrio sulfidiphilus]|uniref:hypothetical protein n=1 Tax=Thioalkalivibrio sulfidiphilus TaxID=1033854 RepID=UPI003BAF18AC